MKFLSFSCLTFLALLLLASCGKEDVADFTDAELITAIQKAEKQAVNAETLPTVSKDVLNEGYTESVVNETLKAEGLGYELNLMRKSGTKIGELSQVYFAIDGRKLDKYDKGKYCDKTDPKCYDDRDKDGWDRKECFQKVFPISLTMPDGSSVSGVDKDELWVNVKDWYVANPSAKKDKPKLQFPLDIIFTDGSTATLDSEEDIKAAYGRCPDREEEDINRDKCFKLLYPISYAMPDGSVISGADDRALWEDIKAWYNANPDANKEEPVLQYPVDIEYLDGATATVAGDEDMRVAYGACPE